MACLLTHNVLFDAIDTNKDGHISIEEFQVYLNLIAPGIKEDEIIHSFDIIDADKNGPGEIIAMKSS